MTNNNSHKDFRLRGNDNLKLKVCGMKHPDNILEVANLQPDYLGFIFYDKSPRYFDGDIPKLPSSIKKVGVFVNETIELILEKIKTHQLNAIQLHGEESPEFCNTLRELCYSELDAESTSVDIIKVFSIKDTFNFNVLQPYESVCNYFLFDTKGKNKGGNGYTFNWSVLNDYPSTKPYFLSGGIGLDEVDNINSFLKTEASKYCYALDVNSKFEIEPGLKNVDLLQKFITL